MVYDKTRENKQKGKTMKKIVLLSLLGALFVNAAVADMYRESVNTCDEAEMRAALVNADQTLSETWSYQLPANE